MWIFLNDSFVSAVEDRTNPDQLCVRARISGDLEQLFGPDVSVLETTDADYRFRCFVSKQLMSEIIADRIKNINYSNFKDSVDDYERHDAYLDVWTAMYRYQQSQ